MTMWKSIDSAPDDLNDYLVFCEDTDEMFVAFRMSPGSSLWAYARSSGSGWGEICCRPSHWYVLPDAPKPKVEERV